MKRLTALVLPLVLAACGGDAHHRTDLLPAFADAVLVPAAPEIDLALPADGPLIRDGVAAGLGPRHGWGDRGPSGRAALAPASSLWAVLPDGRCDELELEVRAAAHPDGRPQRVRVVVNGADAGQLELAGGWEVRRLALPAGVVRAGFNEIELRWEWGVAPRELAEGDDARPVAAAVRRIALERGGAPAAEAGFTVAPEVVRLEGPAVLLVPVDLPRGRSVLDLGGRLGGGRRAEATISMLQLDGTRVELARRRGGGRLARVRLDYATAGPRFLHLEVQRGSLELHRPHLRPPQPSAAAPAARLARPPVRNLVVVVLDAARADHVSAYGYPRPTTPFIDQLAAQGHAFANAVAEAAFTMASVPTLHSGRAVLRHGVYATRHQLSSGVPTLAEILQARGWATSGLSATPNWSREKAGDRGFDDFTETWRLGTFWHSRDPYVLTRLALERLERGFGGRPFLMWLHYVPPHEPYLPAPEHDIFGDPAYDGPVDSSFEALRALRTGEVAPTEADVAELVSLYDGNLRTADDAVGRLLAALRARPDWEQTAVLVVADHGEAFYEHGQQGHNSTLYEETVRVPFILRVPGGVPEASDRGRLVTIADVAPTLLGLLGVPAPPAVDGRDLLATAAAAPRWSVLRSSGEEPHYAVRTERFKLIVRAARPRELYDLRRDPGERSNLVTHRPLLAVALTALLEGELARAAGSAEAAAPPGEESESALRSLGYL